MLSKTIMILYIAIVLHNMRCIPIEVIWKQLLHFLILAQCLDIFPTPEANDRNRSGGGTNCDNFIFHQHNTIQ